MRDMSRIRERAVPRRGADVRVDRAQIVWLTLGGVVSLALMFALGFMVGRRAERLAQADTPPPVAQTLTTQRSVAEELTFYDRLTDPRPVAPPPAPAVAQAAPQGADRPAPSPAAQEPREPREPRAAQAPQSPQPAQSAQSAQPSSPRATGEDRVAGAVARARGAARRGRQDVKRALNAGPAQPGEYTVQVSAFQSLGEAQAFAAGLERKGYKPFVVTSSIDGRGTWYRVRLGRFDTEESATEAKQLLAHADIPAWVLRTE